MPKAQLITPRFTSSALQTSKAPIELGRIFITSLDTVKVDEKEKSIHFFWRNGTSDLLSYTWLRDHCQCPACHHPVTLQRQVDTLKIPKDLIPTSVRVTSEVVEIDWKDSHTTIFPYNWLENVLKPPKENEVVTWDAKTLGLNLPKISYHEVLHSPMGLLKWLELIYTFGFALVTGVPTDLQVNKSNYFLSFFLGQFLNHGLLCFFFLDE